MSERAPIPFQNTERFRKGLEKTGRIFSGNLTTTGAEYFKEIHDSRNVIVATSHITIFDVPFIASQVPREFQIGLPHVSVQDRFLGDPFINPLIRIAGKENFFTIDYPGYKRATEMLPPSAMNMKNFDSIAQAMENGMTPIMSLYNPTHDGLLPLEPAIGTVLLAQLEDALVIPAAMVFDSDKRWVGQPGAVNFVRTAIARANARVSFGMPIELERLNIQPLREFLERRKEKGGGKSLPGRSDPEWEQLIAEAKLVRQALKGQAKSIDARIRAMVPEEKRKVENPS